jgi:hypothetical protein
MSLTQTYEKIVNRKNVMPVSDFQNNCCCKSGTLSAARRSQRRKTYEVPSKMIDKSIRIMKQTIKKYQNLLFLKRTKDGYRLLVEGLIYEATMFPKPWSTTTQSVRTEQNSLHLLSHMGRRAFPTHPVRFELKHSEFDPTKADIHLGEQYKPRPIRIDRAPLFQQVSCTVQTIKNNNVLPQDLNV